MRYHFVVTLQWTIPAGAVNETQHGTVGLQPGATRDEVLQGLIERMRHGRDGTPVVLFFSFGPNEIGGAR